MALQTGLCAAEESVPDEVRTGRCVSETGAMIGDMASAHRIEGKVPKNNGGRGQTV